jgi:hypothetical protein
VRQVGYLQEFNRDAGQQTQKSDKLLSLTQNNMLGAYAHSLSVLSTKEKDFSCPRYEDILNLGTRRR